MNAPVLLSPTIPGTPLDPRRTTDADRLIGARITALRRLHRVSQETLGRAVGLTFQQIQKYEKGINRVGAVRLQEIARFFEVPVGSFFDGEEEAAGLPKGFEGLAVHGAPELLRLFAGIERPTPAAGMKERKRLEAARSSAALAYRRAEAKQERAWNSLQACWSVGR